MQITNVSTFNLNMKCIYHCCIHAANNQTPKNTFCNTDQWPFFYLPHTYRTFVHPCVSEHSVYTRRSWTVAFPTTPKCNLRPSLSVFLKGCVLVIWSAGMWPTRRGEGARPLSSVMHFLFWFGSSHWILFSTISAPAPPPERFVLSSAVERNTFDCTKTFATVDCLPRLPAACEA